MPALSRCVPVTRYNWFDQFHAYWPITADILYYTIFILGTLFFAAFLYGIVRLVLWADKRFRPPYHPEGSSYDTP